MSLMYTRPASILRPYEPYLFERWQAGMHNGLHLWREIVALGYHGTRGNVARFVAYLRRAYLRRAYLRRAYLRRAYLRRAYLRRREREGMDPPAAPPAPGLRPRQAAGLLLVPAVERTADQERAWRQMHQIHPEVDPALTVLQQFLALLRARSSAEQRGARHLVTWLDRAAESGAPELAAFVTKLRQDGEAVPAGLSLPWSQGQMEGHVNRVKLIKRSIYGRGKFDLLRQLVLYHTVA